MSEKKKDISKYKRARLDERVVLILKKSYENIEKKIFVKGKRRKKPYKVDIHAWKSKGLFKDIRIDVWVKLYKKRVDKKMVQLFAESIADVKDAWKDGISDWVPEYGFLASDDGFDSEALELAKKYNFYCMQVDKDGFNFVGNVKPTSTFKVLLQQLLYFTISTLVVIAILYMIKVIFL